MQQKFGICALTAIGSITFLGITGVVVDRLSPSSAITNSTNVCSADKIHGHVLAIAELIEEPNTFMEEFFTVYAAKCTDGPCSVTLGGDAADFQLPFSLLDDAFVGTSDTLELTACDILEAERNEDDMMLFHVDDFDVLRRTQQEVCGDCSSCSMRFAADLDDATTTALRIETTHETSCEDVALRAIEIEQKITSGGAAARRLFETDSTDLLCRESNGAVCSVGNAPPCSAGVKPAMCFTDGYLLSETRFAETSKRFCGVSMEEPWTHRCMPSPVQCGRTIFTSEYTNAAYGFFVRNASNNKQFYGHLKHLLKAESDERWWPEATDENGMPVGANAVMPQVVGEKVRAYVFRTEEGGFESCDRHNETHCATFAAVEKDATTGWFRVAGVRYEPMEAEAMTGHRMRDLCNAGGGDNVAEVSNFLYAFCNDPEKPENSYDDRPLCTNTQNEITTRSLDVSIERTARRSRRLETIYIKTASSANYKRVYGWNSYHTKSALEPYKTQPIVDEGKYYIVGIKFCLENTEKYYTKEFRRCSANSGIGHAVIDPKTYQQKWPLFFNVLIFGRFGGGGQDCLTTLAKGQTNTEWVAADTIYLKELFSVQEWRFASRLVSNQKLSCIALDVEDWISPHKDTKYLSEAEHLQYYEEMKHNV